MDNQIEMSLMSFKECSPMMAFAVFVVVSGITMYMTRSSLKVWGDERIDNLYHLYTWHELKYIIVMGVVLYGLCQYKKENLAWISLTLPILYLLLKNLFIFLHIFSIQQKLPRKKKELPPPPQKKESSLPELIKQQDEVHKQHLQQQQLHNKRMQEQHMQQEQMKQQVHAHYQPPVNKEITGMTPPLNSFGGSNHALF